MLYISENPNWPHPANCVDFYNRMSSKSTNRRRREASSTSRSSNKLQKKEITVLVHFHWRHSNFPPFKADSSQLRTIKEHLHIRRFALTQVLTLLEQAIHIQSGCREATITEGCAIYTNVSVTCLREQMGDVSISHPGKFDLSGHIRARSIFSSLQEKSVHNVEACSVVRECPAGVATDASGCGCGYSRPAHSWFKSSAQSSPRQVLSKQDPRREN